MSGVSRLAGRGADAGPAAGPVVPLLALVVFALPLAGCGLGAGAAPGSVAVTVTDEFGQRQLPAPASLKVVGQETVMSLLERNYKVSTRYGGKFVQSINGLSGDSEGAEPVDWFYYVNGVEAPKGAAATNVHAGDQIWWDRHDWSQTESVPAVVGSFPEPFLHGIDGVRYPVRVAVHLGDGRRPAGRSLGRLREAGVPAAVAATGSGGEPDALQVLVGPFRSIAERHRAPRASSGVPPPAACTPPSPPTARRLNLLHADGHAAPSPRRRSRAAGGHPRRRQRARVGRHRDRPPAGSTRAAEAFDQLSLRDHFAVAVAAAGVVPLPVPGR